jgi:hypothetical protein
MQRPIVYIAAALGGVAFLFMVKLMYDMTGHMGKMTDQVALMSADLGRMRSQMETLVGQVGGIQQGVRYMAPLAADVQGLRESVGSMAGVVHKGSEQIERLNPMQMMEQMMRPRPQPAPASVPEQ